MKEIRPTTGKTLLALINILGSVAGQDALDLFAGSGRVAGALRDHGASVVTVECLRDRARAIRAALGDDRHLCLAMDVRRALPWLARRGMTFDVVFADPPYGMHWMAQLPELLDQWKVLFKENALVVLEHAEGETPCLGGTDWVVTDERRYGLSCLTFLRQRRKEVPTCPES